MVSRSSADLAPGRGRRAGETGGGNGWSLVRNVLDQLGGLQRPFLEYFSNISRIFLGLVGLVASFIYSGPVGDNSRLDSMASRWVALLMTTDRKSNLNGRI